jgi:hypothetical protein
MTSRMSSRTLWAVTAFVLASAPLAAQPAAEQTKSAKTLFFDRDYAKARAAWEAVRVKSRGAEADVALYWIARCSENLKERERALREYGDFLARRPKDPVLAEEARTSRITLATALVKAGQAQHLGIVSQGLDDSSRTVRYYAALQLSTLGAERGRPALPILLDIVSNEKDHDLVDRAKLAIMRIDPTALPELERRGVPGAQTGGRDAHMVRVRISKPGSKEPHVSINVPLALAEIVFKSLPDDARRELRGEGYDPESFIRKLRKLGPSELIDIRGDDGEIIQIWTE